MAWNEPGKNDRPSQPSGNNRAPDSPPDLDEVLKQLQAKLKRLWGNKQSFSREANSYNTSGNRMKPEPYIIYIFIAIVSFLLWVFAGFFVVGPSEKAVILRLGQYIGTELPGLHWIPPFIDDKWVANVQQVSTYPYQAEMLTQDENIVSVDLVVQYRIDNLRDYLFNVANPTESLQQATASALRQVIGQTKLDEVITSGRERVREQTAVVLQNTLQRYHTGLIVMDVNMQPAKPPEQVTAAFDDAIKAREDEQRFKNQATSYANQVVPIAQGDAARLFAEANAYQQKVVLTAKGATAEYLTLLPQYQQAPAVTRERMYLDTLQTILSQTPKILVDTPSANNMMYLPLEQLLHKKIALTNAANIQVPLSLPKENNNVENPVTVPTPLRMAENDNTSLGSRPSYAMPSSIGGQ